MNPVPEHIEDSFIELALSVAYHAHRNQMRRPHNQPTDYAPYIVHPVAVADSLPRPLRALGLLHDVMEDNPEEWSEPVLRGKFPAWLVDRLLLLTKQPGEEYDAYIMRAASDPATRLVKIADLRDNLKDLVKGTQRDKYRLALRVLGEEP